jgi:hypothetical protein
MQRNHATLSDCSEFQSSSQSLAPLAHARTIPLLAATIVTITITVSTTYPTTGVLAFVVLPEDRGSQVLYACEYLAHPSVCTTPAICLTVFDRIGRSFGNLGVCLNTCECGIIGSFCRLSCTFCMQSICL